MPGEHEPHQAVLMAWPTRVDNWRRGAAPAQEAFADLAALIATSTPVTLCVGPTFTEADRTRIPDGVEVVSIPSNDAWMRDIGPSYVVDDAGCVRGVDWQFNAWGGELNGLYDDWADDDALAGRLLALRGETRYRAPLILEGGSVHVDGEGTCFTTAECLLHPGRNPHLDHTEITQHLVDYLDVSTVIWLPRGLPNDETDGHVDNLLHIVGPGEVVLTWCDDPDDPAYDVCRQANDVLESTTDAAGRALTVHRLPAPGPLFMTEEEAAGIEHSPGMRRHAGERLAASYANFLITNNLVIMPFLDPAVDEEAHSILQALFPERRVVGFEAREILLGGGNIHCVTQQVPAVDRVES